MSSRYTYVLPKPTTLKKLPRQIIDLEESSIAPVVSIRRDGSIGPILSGLSRSRLLQVTGPPGCGKSTRVPWLVAQALGVLVLHLIPHPLQAMQLSMTSRSRKGPELGPEDLFIGNSAGLLVLSYAELWSYALRESRSFEEVRKDVVYYCDECHESDAGTYSLVRFVKSKLCRNRSLLVSATLDGQEYASEEAEYPIDEKFVDSGAMECISQILLKRGPHNVLYFDDNPDRRKAVLDFARLRGYVGFELTAKMEPNEFNESQESNSQGKRWFAAADSSFRTGFNFIVQVVIDSCEVGYTLRETGNKMYRAAFEFETYQAKGRLGRNVNSKSGLYVRLRGRGKNLIAKIEGTEISIAKYISFTQGYSLPELACGEIGPKFLSDYSILNDHISLDNLSEDKFVDREIIEVPLDLNERKKSRVDPVSAPSKSFDLEAAFAKLQNTYKDVLIDPNIGGLYCVPGDMNTNDRSPMFPNGKYGILRLLSAGRLSKLSGLLGPLDRNLLSRVLAEEMTSASIKHHGTLQFLGELTSVDTVPNAEQRRMLEKLQSDLSIASASYASMADILIGLQHIVEIDIVSLGLDAVADLVDGLAKALLQEFASYSKGEPRLGLPTLQQLLPDKHTRVSDHSYSRYDSTIPSRKPLAVENASTVSDSASRSSKHSGFSFRDWENNMHRVKKFDGRTGRLI